MNVDNKLGISFSWELLGETPNFTRDAFETIEELKNFPENRLPDVFISSVVETGRAYIFRKNVESTNELGKWREISNQYEVMPEANSGNKNDVYQYIGETNDDFTKGAFYSVKEEDTGETNIFNYYCVKAVDDETIYFSLTNSFEDGEPVPLLKKNEDGSFVNVKDTVTSYDGVLYLNDELEAIRAEDLDETIETPIYNYSWIPLSSGGAGTDETEVKKLIKKNAADADYKTINNPDLVLNADAADIGDATIDYDLAELFQDENALNDFVALLNERYLGGTVISSEYPDDHFVKDINEIKVSTIGGTNIYINGLDNSNRQHNINIYTKWKSLYTFSNPVEKVVTIRDALDSMKVEAETETIDFSTWED